VLVRPPTVLLLTACALLAVSCSHPSRDQQDAAPRATGVPVSPAPADHVTPTPTSSPTPSPRARATTPAPRPTTAAPRPAAKAVRHYAFPVRGCAVSYGHSHHDYPATDVFAARGCAVVSPVTGTVDEDSTVDRWSSTTNRGADRGGLSFSVVGVDGVRYYGSHLSTVLVRPGQHVAVGQRVGTVGNTGSARGIATHLHFGISWPTRHGVWWVRRGEVYPWSYLDSWRAGGSRSPAAAVAAKHRQLGDVPPCRVDC
jgi:murein DD-endopeptidase MepM/ murein hydrolase activator NlpD